MSELPARRETGLDGGFAGDSAIPAADGRAGETDAPAPGTFTRDVFPIVKETCALAGCHLTALSTNHFTDFSTEERTYKRWVDAPGWDFCIPNPGHIGNKIIVVPGRPDQSFLMEKITSTREELCDEVHFPRMPPAPRPPLTSDQIEVFRKWIAEGALPN